MKTFGLILIVAGLIAIGYGMYKDRALSVRRARVARLHKEGGIIKLPKGNIYLDKDYTGCDIILAGERKIN